MILVWCLNSKIKSTTIVLTLFQALFFQFPELAFDSFKSGLADTWQPPAIALRVMIISSI